MFNADPGFNPENVDWAALAHQWIQMRETLPPELMNNSPFSQPPQQQNSAAFTADVEQGEADMMIDPADTLQNGWDCIQL